LFEEVEKEIVEIEGVCACFNPPFDVIKFLVEFQELVEGVFLGLKLERPKGKGGKFEEVGTGFALNKEAKLANGHGKDKFWLGTFMNQFIVIC